MRAVAVVVAALTCQGCLLGSIVFTRHERLNETQVGSRVASRPADVDGTECYVDQKVRVRERVHSDSWWRIGGGFNALLFGMGAGTSDSWVVPAIAIDGLLAFAYSALINGHESNSDRWEETLETASCHH